MENMQHAEELVKEFLVFRGFTTTLQAFESDLSTDVGKGFQVDKILDLIFRVYVPKFQAEKLIGLIGFFKQCFGPSEVGCYETLLRLEVSILRYYVVHAVRSSRKDKVVELFGMLGDELRRKGDDWAPWFAIPYLKSPSTDPQFRIYFSKEWSDALHLSMRNFLSQMFDGARIPALLKISTEKNTINRLRKDIKQLNAKLSELQAVLEEREAQLRQLRRHEDSFLRSSSMISGEASPLKDSRESLATTSYGVAESSTNLSSAAAYGVDHESSSTVNVPVRDGYTDDTSHVSQYETFNGGTTAVVLGEEEFSEVKVQFQETFLGHTSAISRSRFSASGDNIASASVDGTVRIWTYDPSMPGTRNATIYCGAEILSLDWDCKSDRLALLREASKHGMLTQKEWFVISAQVKHIEGYWM